MFDTLRQYSYSKKTASLSLIAIVFACFTLDQWSKYWAKNLLMLSKGQMQEAIPGLFSFRYVENRGAAFGIFPDARLLFLAITLMVIALSIYIVVKSSRHGILQILSFGCLLGGAMGNAYDRLIFHYVTDFIATDFIDFPVFNVADIFVCLGSFLLMLYIMSSDFNAFSHKEEVDDGAA